MEVNSPKLSKSRQVHSVIEPDLFTSAKCCVALSRCDKNICFAVQQPHVIGKKKKNSPFPPVPPPPSGPLWPLRTWIRACDYDLCKAKTRNGLFMEMQVRPLNLVDAGKIFHLFDWFCGGIEPPGKDSMERQGPFQYFIESPEVNLVSIPGVLLFYDLSNSLSGLAFAKAGIMERKTCSLLAFSNSVSIPEFHFKGPSFSVVCFCETRGDVVRRKRCV